MHGPPSFVSHTLNSNTQKALLSEKALPVLEPMQSDTDDGYRSIMQMAPYWQILLLLLIWVSLSSQPDVLAIQ